ncbi:MAG TPA: molybdopterin cofactor-binding domain-containing protein [Planosporangium sp.]|nr:molybdopterin cofactor-binding domain-containing protein [Planosporangium sp.]
MTRKVAAPAAATNLPNDLAANPRLSRWVTFESGRVLVRVGKVELGQGILTALARIAAQELDVSPDRIGMVAADTALSPDEGITAGSMSVAESGAALRQVCAEVRSLLLAAAAPRAGGDPARLSVVDGVVYDPQGRPLSTYWELAGEVSLDVDATGEAVASGPGQVMVASLSRLDLPDKVFGRPRFIHDLELPEMAHGRVVRPARRGARLTDLVGQPLRGLPGVLAVVRDGGFLGVVAEQEDTAERAAGALARAAVWEGATVLPDEQDLPAYLRAQPAEVTLVHATGCDGVAGEKARHSAVYSRPFLAHASMAPSCGIARWNADGGVSVWSHSQGVFALRRAVAQAVGLDADRVRVRHVEGAGCYGHNAADDAAFDAVLLARSVPGRPVRVQWSRRDELGWAPFGSAMVAEVSATLDGDGRVAHWSYDVWSHGHASRPGYAGSPGLLATADLEKPFDPPAAVDPPAERGGGTARNAVPAYDFAGQRVTAHRLLTMPIRTSALRSLGAYLNVFAIESFMDELAAMTGRDPVDYRLAHLSDERARAVLERAAREARWGDPTTEDGLGRGIGFARYKNRGAYCAVVAEVEAVRRVRVRRLVVAVDVGCVIDPDGVRNQIEGGAVQATSWTVKERVRFDRAGVTSTDWESYPILRFSEVPRVDVHVLARRDDPSVGAGEAAQGPVAAAIANAVFDAIGVRVRHLPLTAEQVIAAMDAGGPGEQGPGEQGPGEQGLGEQGPGE